MSLSFLSFYHLVSFLAFFVRAPSPPETPLPFRSLGLVNRRRRPPSAVACRLLVPEGTKPCVQVRVPPSPLSLCFASGVVRRRNRELIQVAAATDDGSVRTADHCWRFLKFTSLPPGRWAHDALPWPRLSRPWWSSETVAAPRPACALCGCVRAFSACNSATSPGLRWKEGSN